MEEKKETLPEKEGRTFSNLGTPIMITTGFGVSSTRNLVVLTLFFSPPENEKTVNVLFRAGLLPEAAEQLAKSLKNALEKLGKKSEE